MEDFNIHIIEQAIVDFMINVVNLFSEDRIYSFEFASRQIKNKLMRYEDKFVDFRFDLHNNVFKLMQTVVDNDCDEFVAILVELTFLTEILLRLDDIKDQEKIEKVTNYSGVCYDICLDNLENFKSLFVYH